MVGPDQLRHEEMIILQGCGQNGSEICGFVTPGSVHDGSRCINHDRNAPRTNLWEEVMTTARRDGNKGVPRCLKERVVTVATRHETSRRIVQM